MNANPTTRRAAKQSLATSFRLCSAEGIAAMPIVSMSLPVNVVLAALFTKVYALPTGMIGLLAALPFVCNFLQIGVTPLLARWRSPKVVSLTFGTLHMCGWIAFIVLLQTLPPGDGERAGRWFAAWFFITSLFGSVTGVSWNAWVQEWVPGRLRGKYFGRRNRLLQLSSLCFWLLAGWSLSRWDYAIPAFQLLAAGAVALRALSIWLQVRMPTGARFDTGGDRLPLKEQLRTVLAARSFRTFILFGAVWSFAANCFGPFYHVFMFRHLGMSAFEVGLLATTAALGGALSMPGWGALLDRFGNKAVMTVSLILWQGQNLLWCILTPDNRELLYGMWAWGGITSAGFVLGLFTLQLKLIPTKAKNLAIGCNLALTSLVAAIAPALGGAVLETLLARSGNPISVYHLCFLAQPVIALSGAFLLLRVHEPAAASLGHVVGAMRNIRTLSGIFGLGFLADYIFYRPNRR